MHAKHITARWERVACTGLTPTQWIHLLLIADAGEAGVSSKAFAKRTRNQHDGNQRLKPFVQSGLIKREERPSWSPKLQCKARGMAWYTITAKGLDVLGLQPVPETATKEAQP